jgi:4-hydroxy-tetrahydrodipicolinate reductase
MKKEPLRILLIGYGKMGKAIELVAKEKGHSVSGIISDRQMDLAHICKAYQPNIAFEFTSPASAPLNLEMLLEAGIPVVCGSTGWLDQWERISGIAKANNGSFFYASNFSLGMNLLFKLVQDASRFMDAFPEYEVDIEEIHHTEKKDMPSGTAITLAERILAEMKRKKSWELNANSTESTIGVNAIRQPDVPGTHTVAFRSAIDTIELSHTAHSRMGFAQGAVKAGEWLLGRKGVFTMNDLLGL